MSHIIAKFKKEKEAEGHTVTESSSATSTKTRVATARDRKTDSGHRVGFRGFPSQREYTATVQALLSAITNDPSLTPDEKRIAKRGVTPVSAHGLLNRYLKAAGLLPDQRTPK